MTHNPEQDSPAPKLPGSDAPGRKTTPSRFGMRHLVVGAGLVIMASVPLLVRGEQAPSKPAAGPPAAKASPDAAKATPDAAKATPDAAKADPDAAKTAAPTAAAVAGEKPTPIPATAEERAPVVDHEAARSYRRIATNPNEGAEPVEAPIFDCNPVKKDDSVSADQFPVPLPPFSEGVFPCTRCHDKPDDFNTTKRNLTLEHTKIKLNHGPREQWCYGCHNPTGRDQLRLAGGRTIDFLKSYELCGQCHGPKLRDWRLGIHGRRTGCWNGKREYLLCVHCHNPHSPKFTPLKPKPRPMKPSEIHSKDKK